MAAVLAAFAVTAQATLAGELAALPERAALQRVRAGCVRGVEVEPVTTLDLKGATLMPGLTDAHHGTDAVSRAGQDRQGDRSSQKLLHGCLPDQRCHE